MNDHKVFHSAAGFLLLTALAMAYFVTWASLPFFMFAFAAALRGASLQRSHRGLKIWSYSVFIVGFLLLGYYVVLSNLLV